MSSSQIKRCPTHDCKFNNPSHVTSGRDVNRRSDVGFTRPVKSKKYGKSIPSHHLSTNNQVRLTVPLPHAFKRPLTLGSKPVRIAGHRGTINNSQHNCVDQEQTREDIAITQNMEVDQDFDNGKDYSDTHAHFSVDEIEEVVLSGLEEQQSLCQPKKGNFFLHVEHSPSTTVLEEVKHLPKSKTINHLNTSTTRMNVSMTKTSNPSSLRMNTPKSSNHVNLSRMNTHRASIRSAPINNRHLEPVTVPLLARKQNHISRTQRAAV